MDKYRMTEPAPSESSLAAEGVADFLRSQLRGLQRGTWTNDEIVFESIGRKSADGVLPLDTRNQLVDDYIREIRPKHPDIAHALETPMNKHDTARFYFELQNKISDFKYAAGISAAGVEFFSWKWQSEIRHNDLRSSNPLKQFLLNEVNQNFDFIRNQSNQPVQDGTHFLQTNRFLRTTPIGITNDDLTRASLRAEYPMRSYLR